MYNLLEYIKNYRKTTGSLYNYCRDELDDDANLNDHPNNNVFSSRAFQCKSKLLGNTPDVSSTHVVGGARVANSNYNANESGIKNVILVVPLKYLGSFWGALNIPLISCEVWDKN